MEETTNSQHHHSKPKGFKHKLFAEPTWAGKALVLMVMVASLLLIATMAKGLVPNKKLVKKGQYQAIFLTNGQVYFGKLSAVNGQYIKLSNIYYLQQDQNVQASGSQSTDKKANLTLVKLGNELHGPEDEMFIDTDKIIFWENLKNDGRVATEINKTGQ